MIGDGHVASAGSLRMRGRNFISWEARFFFFGSVPLDADQKEAGLWIKLTAREEVRAERIAEYDGGALIMQYLKLTLLQLPVRELINCLVF